MPSPRAPTVPRIVAARLPAGTPAEAAADNVIHRLHQSGHAAFRVGGAVRDRLLGRTADDVDVATDATPRRVRNLFARTYAVGESFGVVIVHTDSGIDVEVATFREETGYADGRHPEAVRFSTPARDATRRDFTINALFYDPTSETVTDFAGGLDDLTAGVVRAIGDPAERFAEDHLRLLRAVRFAAGLGFRLEPATAQAARAAAAQVADVSPERVRAELTSMLSGPAPDRALALLDELGLLPVWLPEVAAMKGVPQPPQFHPEGDVWQHTLLMLGLMRAAREALAWAVLLHDVGKPPTHEFSNGRDRFPCHAGRSADMAREILRRLRAPNRLIDSVAECVGLHMQFMDAPKMRPARLRRMLGRPTFHLELELHRLDCAASHQQHDTYVYLLDRLAELANEPPVPEPLVRGRDVLALGIPPGPRVGCLLHLLHEWQLEGNVSTREEALARLREQVDASP